MSIREKHTDKMEEILEKEMYADEGFSEIDEEDQRPETQKVMKQERRQQRKNRRKSNCTFADRFGHCNWLCGYGSILQYTFLFKDCH